MKSDRQLQHLLLSLHEDASVLSPREFCHSALQRCQPMLGFDSAVFGSGVLKTTQPNGPVQQSILAFELFQQPVEKMLADRNFRGPDPILSRASQNIGQIVTMSVESLTGIGRPDIVDYAHRYDVNHTMILMQGQPVAGVEALSLWRGARRDFGLGHRSQGAMLLPHLMLARRNNLRFNGLARVVSEAAPLTVLASPAGYMHSAPPELLACLQGEWPQWQPPLLPAPLMLALQQSSDMSFRGRSLRIKAFALDGLLRIDVKVIGPKDLSAAEARVADLIAEGLSYKQVAQRLQRSPATVRNQLQTIYDKLGLRGKAALARLWTTRQG